jgi:protein-S-isoprenylcysteine O-methyltransferase Ste14
MWDFNHLYWQNRNNARTQSKYLVALETPPASPVVRRPFRAAPPSCRCSVGDKCDKSYGHSRECSTRVCGRYSRHPNYSFESLVWWGFSIAVLGFPWGWTSLICPVLMLYFLLRVTGIPLTEKHSIESHGEAYRNYQRRTNRFIPWLAKER